MTRRVDQRPVTPSVDKAFEGRAVTGLVRMRRDYLRGQAEDKAGEVTTEMGRHGSRRFYDRGVHVATDAPKHRDGHRITFHAGRRGTPTFVTLTHTTPSDGTEPTFTIKPPVEGDIYPVLRKLNLV